MNDVLLIIVRSLRNTRRTPAAIIPNVAISVFFLFVYNSGLTSVAKLPGFKGTYLGFILPVAIVSAAVGGAGSAGRRSSRTSSRATSPSSCSRRRDGSPSFGDRWSRGPSSSSARCC